MLLLVVIYLLSVFSAHLWTRIRPGTCQAPARRDSSPHEKSGFKIDLKRRAQKFRLEILGETFVGYRRNFFFCKIAKKKHGFRAQARAKNLRGALGSLGQPWAGLGSLEADRASPPQTPPLP